MKDPEMGTFFWSVQMSLDAITRALIREGQKEIRHTEKAEDSVTMEAGIYKDAEILTLKTEGGAVSQGVWVQRVGEARTDSPLEAPDGPPLLTPTP